MDLRYFYPHTLDFVSQNSIQIYFVGGYEYIQNARGFSFGTINDTLSCYSDLNCKICTVYKRYFKGKKNGEYSIYQINSLNENIFSLSGIKKINSFDFNVCFLKNYNYI